MGKVVVSTKDFKGVDATELRNFCESLDMVEQEATGYGSLKSAVIVCEFDGVVLTATYADQSWRVVMGKEEK